jgi:hypothetical protein
MEEIPSAFPKQDFPARSAPARRSGFFVGASSTQTATRSGGFSMNKYTTAQVVEATGVSLSALHRYISQGHIKFLACDYKSSGSGERHEYSERRVLQTGIIVECKDLGITPSRASKAALEFTDRGNPGRAIGELYPLGTTYLVGLPRKENRVVNVPPDLSVADVLSNDTAAFIINLNNVVAKVTERLK